MVKKGHLSSNMKYEKKSLIQKCYIVKLAHLNIIGALCNLQIESQCCGRQEHKQDKYAIK